MRLLFRFFRLPVADRSLLVKAAFTVGATRLGLWVLSFGTLRRILARVRRRPARLRRADQSSLDRVAWAVTVASRFVPAATCLTQALATHVLLDQQGYSACLRIGVVKGEDGQLRAHAWVESDGVVVMGGSEPSIERYTPLPAFEGEGL
jgi:hypothetical protein